MSISSRSKIALTIVLALGLVDANCTPLQAQPSTKVVEQIQGVAVADYDRSVQQTNAFITASQQLKTSFQSQLTSIEARGKVLDTELKTLVDRYQAARTANPANPTLKAQEQAIVQKQQAGREEIANMAAPYNRAREYVLEQFSGKLKTAVESAMAKRRVGIIVNPESVIGLSPSNDLTADITAELNVLVPTASTAVPANWQPGQQPTGAN